MRVNNPYNNELKSSIYYRCKDNSKFIKEPSIDLISKLLKWLSTNNDLYNIREEL